MCSPSSCETRIAILDTSRMQMHATAAAAAAAAAAAESTKCSKPQKMYIGVLHSVRRIYH